MDACLKWIVPILRERGVYTVLFDYITKPIHCSILGDGKVCVESAETESRAFCLAALKYFEEEKVPTNYSKAVISIEHLRNGYWSASYKLSSGLHILTKENSCDLFHNYTEAKEWLTSELDYFWKYEANNAQS